MEIEDQASLEGIRFPVWTWLVVALSVMALYALTLENGAALSTGADVLHELFHDARHMLGVPCH